MMIIPKAFFITAAAGYSHFLYDRHIISAGATPL